MRMDKLTSRLQHALAHAQSLPSGRDPPALDPVHVRQGWEHSDRVVGRSFSANGWTWSVGERLLEKAGDFYHAHSVSPKILEH